MISAATNPLTQDQIYELVNKHFSRYNLYAFYVKKQEIPKKKEEKIFEFLSKILPTMEYREPEEGFVFVSYNFYNSNQNLYYNDMHHRKITNTYELVDDALHFYFHTMDRTEGEANFILLYPLYNSARKLDKTVYEKDAMPHPLTERDIKEIIQFHMGNRSNECDEEGDNRILYMKQFVSQALSTIVNYNGPDPNYRAWMTDTPIDSLYHEANNRVEWYMMKNNIFDIEPFVMTTKPEPPMDVQIDDIPMSLSSTTDSTIIFDKTMIENLERSFSGMRM